MPPYSKGGAVLYDNPVSRAGYMSWLFGRDKAPSPVADNPDRAAAAKQTKRFQEMANAVDAELKENPPTKDDPEIFRKARSAFRSQGFNDDEVDAMGSALAKAHGRAAGDWNFLKDTARGEGEPQRVPNRLADTEPKNPGVPDPGPEFDALFPNLIRENMQVNVNNQLLKQRLKKGGPTGAEMVRKALKKGAIDSPGLPTI